MTSPSPFLRYVFNVIDSWTRDVTPNGVAVKDNISAHLTNAAFDYYIATYGLPCTANQARHMFEWAATFETTYAICYEMEDRTHDADIS